MIEADGIILASPTYFANISAELKPLIDRSGMTSIANGGMFKRKLDAAVVAVRRCGSIHAFNAINYFFFIAQMFGPGSTYWSMRFGWTKGMWKKTKKVFVPCRSLVKIWLGC